MSLFNNYWCNSGVLVKFDNCTFANISSTSSYPTVLYAYYGEGPLYILNSAFYNLSAPSASYAASIFLTFGGYTYNITGNSFLEISGSRSTIYSYYSYDNPTTCPHNYNVFINITSNNYGGVLFLFIYFFFLSIIL
jgi:hypothetical protein